MSILAKKPIITQAQEIHIRTVLIILDKIIDTLQKLYFTKSKAGILYLNLNNLSRMEKVRLISKFNEIRKKEKNEIRRFFGSRLASMWTMISEIKSKRLRWYGTVDNSLKEIMNPFVEKTNKSLNDVKNI